MNAQDRAIARDLAARARLAVSPLERIRLDRPPQTTERRLKYHQARAARRLGEPRSLSKRQVEVLRYLSHGLTVRMAADAMGIEHETARTHLRNARAKLAAKNRAHAVAIALRHGIIN